MCLGTLCSFNRGMNWPTENEQPTNAYKSRPSASSPPSFFSFLLPWLAPPPELKFLKIIGPFCIPLYFGAGSSDVLEDATAMDEIRRGKRAIDGDLNLLDDDNVEECIRMLRFLGFNV